MLINDPIGDALTRIRNAHARQKTEVSFPHSKMLEAIVGILKDEEYIEDYEIVGDKSEKCLSIKLKYIDGKPAIRFLKRTSKPGLRKYIGYRDVKPVLNGLGISILTSPKGVITGKQAVEKKLGGEFICTIY